jgi:hypothetical protein
VSDATQTGEVIYAESLAGSEAEAIQTVFPALSTPIIRILILTEENR